jgi:hypothetical protein
MENILSPKSRAQSPKGKKRNKWKVEREGEGENREWRMENRKNQTSKDICSVNSKPQTPNPKLSFHNDGNFR